MNLLANGHKKDSTSPPEFDFSIHKYFPVMKLNWMRGEDRLIPDKIKRPIFWLRFHAKYFEIDYYWIDLIAVFIK